MVDRYLQAFTAKSLGVAATPNSSLEAIWEEHVLWNDLYSKQLLEVGSSEIEMQPPLYRGSNLEDHHATIKVDNETFSIPNVNMLSSKMGWSDDQTKRAIRGYEQFLQVMVDHSRQHIGEIVPSTVVDDVWHHHQRHVSYYTDMVQKLKDTGRTDVDFRHDASLVVKDIAHGQGPHKYEATKTAARLLGKTSELDPWAWPEKVSLLGCFSWPTPPPTAEVVCGSDEYKSGHYCFKCKTCGTGSEIKSACTKYQDAVCQCSRGYVGTGGNSCTACSGDKEFQDDVDQSTCKTCADGKAGLAQGASNAHTQCEGTRCQHPAAPANSHIDSDNCPEDADHSASCSLACNAGFTQSSMIPFTCGPDQGSTSSSYHGGSIDCKKNTCTCPHGPEASGAACTSDGAHICGSCDAGYFLNETNQCAQCKTCGSGSEVKAACTSASDTLCQCSRGYVGSLGDSCTACNGEREFQDEVDQSSCKMCIDGASGITTGNANGDGHTACNGNTCQYPGPQQNHPELAPYAHVDRANCPENGAQNATCNLVCNYGYDLVSHTPYTCKPVQGTSQASYQGGSIECTIQKECSVTIYEHFAKAQNLEFTGKTKTMNGTGTFPLGDFKVTSSVHVGGEGCAAYGHRTDDCSGERGTPITSATQLGGQQLGLVGPSYALTDMWGCNDCVRCIEVTQQ
jgi:hypothetical protein